MRISILFAGPFLQARGARAYISLRAVEYRRVSFNSHIPTRSGITCQCAVAVRRPLSSLALLVSMPL